MTEPTLSEAERRHNAAQAFESARMAIRRGLKELDGIPSGRAYLMGLDASAVVMDAIVEIQGVAAKTAPLAFGSELLTRLDDNPSEYVEERVAD